MGEGAGTSSYTGSRVAFVDMVGKWLRGRARREGRKLLPRPRPVGDVGPGDEAVGRLRTGDSARGATESVGDVDLTTAGEAGRARRDMPAADGLAGRGSPPAKRLTAGLAANWSDFSWELGPGMRRRRSSS
jgi:hypothetical protein